MLGMDANRADGGERELRRSEEWKRRERQGEHEDSRFAVLQGSYIVRLQLFEHMRLKEAQGICEPVGLGALVWLGTVVHRGSIHTV